MKTLLTLRNTTLSAVAVTVLGITLGARDTLAARALGIDVSSYQGGGINWTSVKNSGRSFAWAKATEGTSITDSDFTINQNNGKAAGVFMGGYHFAHPASASAATEENHFWAVAGGYIKSDGKTLMPMLDMEVFTGHVGASSYSDWANQWNNAAVADAAANGVRIVPFIYTSACSACNFDGSVAGWNSDIADYNGQNSQTGTPWSTCGNCAVWGSGVWDAWQYTDSASVSGVSGGVDGDVINGASASPYVAQATYLPGDFTGDGKTDYALFNAGSWQTRASTGTGVITSFSFGTSGDIPLIGNWSGPSTAEAALFRPSTGTWYVRFHTGTTTSFSWGINGDIPLIGGWSGQMRDQTMFRPSNGTWYIRYGDTGTTTSLQYGQAGDIPLVGDFDGKGMKDQVVFRPSNGTWYVRFGGTDGSSHSFPWGASGDIPLIGAWSGQMRDACLFRPSTATWYIRFGSDGHTVSFPFGATGDQPMVGNIFGHGVIDQILFRPSTGTWYVRDGNTGTVYNFAFGNSSYTLVHE
jgi:GH25 family lysozyme M1 (1,4-beta-N-acetylmuramidase)